MLTTTNTNAYAHELYARGYILREGSAPVAPAHWSRGTFADFYYAHDPRLEATRVAVGRTEILCLGLIVDVRHPLETREDCLGRLASALRRSEKAFLEHVDLTGGRYVLATRRGRCLSLMTDATGMKSAFYYGGQPRMVSSHPYLMMENGSHLRLRGPIRTKFGYPGLRAPIQKGFLLTPNTWLDLSTFQAARFWPRQAVPGRSVDEAAEIVRANMQGIVDHLRSRHRLVVSATAGLDSRLTLSFLKEAPDVKFFSYYRSDTVDTDVHDVAFAETLSKDLGREVQILRSREMSKTPEDFQKVLKANAFLDHIKRMAWAYYEVYGGHEDLVHIRSNISEVGREFWRGKKFDVHGGKDLARVYLQGEKEYQANYVFRVIELFEEFDKITKLTECANMVDIKSLFYWEFRMASWHAQLVAESDVAFETQSLFNCRATLEAMLSVPRAARLDGMVLRHVIAQNWPELANYPVNGNAFWPDTTAA